MKEAGLKDHGAAKSSPAMKKTRKAAKKRPKSQTRSRPKSTARPKRAERPSSDLERGSATSELLRELTEHHGVSPTDSGGGLSTRARARQGARADGGPGGVR